jgi:MSHA biogenesis protein MshO
MHLARIKGFTLVEMVLVIVLLGIVAGILAPVITQNVTAYHDTEVRTELVAKGRLALERMARVIRTAVPNSIEVVTDPSGNQGVQFLSTRAAGRVVAIGEDFGSGASKAFKANSRRFKHGVVRSELYIVNDGIAALANDHIIIGNHTASELRSGTTIVALYAIANTVAATDGTTNGLILQFSNHTFPNDTPSRSFQIADSTHEIGFLNNSIRWRRATGLTDYDTDGDWGSTDPIVVDTVQSVSFAYDPGSTSSSGVVRISLTLNDGNETIDLYQEVRVRLTP